MRFARQILLIASLSTLFLAGCTKYATEEELTRLRDTEAASKKAESRVSEVKQERKTVEDKIADRERELQEADTEKTAVDSRLKEMNK